MGAFARVGGTKKGFLSMFVFVMATAVVVSACGSGGADSVTLIFSVVDSECEADAYVGGYKNGEGSPVPGLPIQYGDSDVTYVYEGRCPSEGIYIYANEIGGTSFVTDYYFNCRSDPFLVEVYFTGSYCSERVIE